MAKINEIDIKNIETLYDHEDYPIVEGDVYYKGTKLGHWCQNKDCGSIDEYDFDTTILEKEVENVRGSFIVPMRYRKCFNLELLLHEIVQLNKYEEEFNVCIKEGHKTLVRCFSSGYCTDEDDRWDIKESDEYMELTEKYPNETVYIFRDLGDFNLHVISYEPLKERVHCDLYEKINDIMYDIQTDMDITSGDMPMDEATFIWDDVCELLEKLMVYVLMWQSCRFDDTEEINKAYNEAVPEWFEEAWSRKE